MSDAHPHVQCPFPNPLTACYNRQEAVHSGGSFQDRSSTEGLESSCTANAKIISVGPGELELIADLYCQVFNPPQDEAFFQRRFHGRYNISLFVAMLDDQHVGFTISYELRPSTYYCWLCGVLPDARRLGVATQLIQGQQAFAVDYGYTMIRYVARRDDPAPRPGALLRPIHGFAHWLGFSLAFAQQRLDLRLETR